MLSRLGHALGAYARKNSCIRETVKKMVQPHLFGAKHTGILEITPLHARRSDNNRPRITLLVPSINQAHVFGGISTALSFFEKIAQEAGVRKRIVTTDTMPEPEALARFKDYVRVPSTQDSDHDRQIVGFGDRYGKTLPVGEKDYFMATAWWTAHHAQKLMGWQRRTFDSPPGKTLYFIQDFEPGFYPWSSRYVLADSTYRWNHPQVAVFNSSLLYAFFKKNHYAFEDEFVFEPVLGATLKIALEERRPVPKKKQVFVYGRPSVERNAFPLIIEALRAWVHQQDRFHDWQLVSAGEIHPDIDLGCGMVLESLGKLSISDYIDRLRESAVGVSLMVSPHPSYPPMEMAMFGMGVISNTYANKQLSAWHENIHSIDLTLDSLVHALSDRCEKFVQDPACFQDKKLLKKEYMAPERQFYFMKDLAGSLFKEPGRKES